MKKFLYILSVIIISISLSGCTVFYDVIIRNYNSDDLVVKYKWNKNDNYFLPEIKSTDKIVKLHKNVTKDFTQTITPENIGNNEYFFKIPKLHSVDISYLFRRTTKVDEFKILKDNQIIVQSVNKGDLLKKYFTKRDRRLINSGLIYYYDVK